jgi:predicted XRE-type DNA-binding protein
VSNDLDTKIIRSSGNVFRDLGRADADLLLFKSHLAVHISEQITRRGWTQARAAEVLGVDQPRVSDLVRGRLSKFSVDALLGFLKRLDVKMNITLEEPAGETTEKVLIAV